MDILSAILLGLIQGLTEFLPVSSSGHLVLSQHLLGFHGPNLAFDVLVHLATLFAVVLYFRKDILSIFSSALARSDDNIDGRRWLLMIAIGTVPTAIIGFTFREQFEAIFATPKLTAVMLWVTAIILIASDRVRVKVNSSRSRLTVPRAIMVGIVQGLAIIPGISRSGSTISMGLFSGLNPQIAARFSFLLSVPAIMGATILEFGEIVNIGAQDYLPYSLAALTAFYSGYLAIDILMKMVIKRKLWKFSIYLFVVGLLGLLLT
ncbi:undecaprenyl-diphosphatase UppP [candidate division LCP-89 bacterium B3_LCP]|uniref:Undecaprenyl-diphosphatase n=1 Tax=candidate division LCP-89 bacterium B3_LCP TaxID=2012998 RepID=A0A532UY16_UNCL8|nr:MAG: undecaprenyl-diphosphatase UppP [candidate division LCP-89 bacterium B3_LCP]